MSLVRQADNNIGPCLSAVLVGQRLLDDIILAAPEAAPFQQALQHEFAPSAADLRLALQRLRERMSLVGDMGIQQTQLFDLTFQRCPVVALGFIDGVNERAEVY